MRRPGVLLLGVSVVVLLGSLLVLATFSGDDGGRELTTGDAITSTTAPPGATSVPTETPPTALADVAGHTSPLDGPSAVAAALVGAETAIRDPATSPSEIAAWGRTQQAAYRRFAVHPEWDAVILPAVPDLIRAVVEKNVRATRELRALTDPKEELRADWQIISPEPAENLLAAYNAAEAEFGVPWGYLAAIHLVETRLGRIRGASDAGAQGPMQFIPSTWERYGEGDINDTGDAIRAAARYLVAAGAPADMDKALFAYNHSDHYVDAVKAHAEVMLANERAFLGYYHWQVYYRLTIGDVLLEEGYGA